MQKLKIRPAEMKDASQIGAVGYSAWLNGIGKHVGREVHERINSELYASFARASFLQITVAEYDGLVVGFAGTESGENYISDLWVSPDFEGFGIGSTLVSTMEEIVVNRGYDTVEIEVLTANTRALQLYQHLGYGTVWQGTREDPFLCVNLHKTVLRKTVGEQPSTLS